MIGSNLSFRDRESFDFPITTIDSRSDDLVLTSVQEVVDGQVVRSSKLVYQDSSRFDGMHFRDFSLANQIAVNNILDEPMMLQRNRIAKENQVLSELQKIDYSKLVPDEKD